MKQYPIYGWLYMVVLALYVLVTQVTGFIARRNVNWAKKRGMLQIAERFGLFKIRSYTEIFLPLNVGIVVSAGNKVWGRETIVGRVISDE